MSIQVLPILSALVMLLMALAATAGHDATVRDLASGQAAQQAGTELNMVETAPISEPEQANPRPGQSEPAAGQAVAGEAGKPSPGGLPVRPAGWATYVDSTFGFRIGYPNGFVIRPQNVAKLAQFTPTPVVSIFFMNPTMAAGDLAGIEPPDLEVRVYEAGAVDSLKHWLISVGFASTDGGAVEPYRNASVSGLKVCQSTMIAPGCSVYVLHRGRVYQLTPISREGEAMMETFAPPP